MGPEVKVASRDGGEMEGVDPPAVELMEVVSRQSVASGIERGVSSEEGGAEAAELDPHEVALESFHRIRESYLDRNEMSAFSPGKIGIQADVKTLKSIKECLGALLGEVDASFKRPLQVVQEKLGICVDHLSEKGTDEELGVHLENAGRHLTLILSHEW